MAVQFTKDQEKVILQRNKNILVSAAAGSGKTAVLTERIIRLVSQGEEKTDIDRLLVVTFTSAAASEMRERIRNALTRKVEEYPEDDHLQRQITLIHNAQITTIDSFCLYIIRNNFNDIGLDPGFRVADTGEISLLKKDAAQELLEESFELANPSFLHCVECFSKPGKEGNLMDYVMNLYNFAMSYPFPLKWLRDSKESYVCSSLEEFETSTMITGLVSHIKDKLKDCCELLEAAIVCSEEADGPGQYLTVLINEKEILSSAIEHEKYSDFYKFFTSFEFGRLPGKKNPDVAEEKKELVKNIRDFVKKNVKGIASEYFASKPEVILEDTNQSYEAVAQLIDLTCQFHDRFSEKKREKNLIDFSDMEHFALSILIEEKDGAFVPTKTAYGYREYYKEIMTDEYQDSNLVQEYLLWSISNEAAGKNNRFMVGDVKQSIYKFRLARPEIFMEKYKTYPKEANDTSVRIDLKQNFRSRHEVIDTVNQVFGQIMTEALGGITYDHDAALYSGAKFPINPPESDTYNDKNNDYETEVILLEMQSEEEEDPIEKNDVDFNKREAEALAVASRIKELYGKFYITDPESGNLRPALYKDMVILLRSNAGWDETFKKTLEGEGIPCYITSKAGYFSALEIKEVLNFLRIIDNPRQDIPLCSVLKSGVYQFTDEELTEIRCDKTGRHETFYESMKRFAGLTQETEQTYKEQQTQEKTSLIEKTVQFLSALDQYRKLACYTPIHELIYHFYYQEGFYYYSSALPGGEQRKANLDMLVEKAQSFEHTSYHGLFHFIRYMEQLEKYEVDYGEANIADETANVVRIMSIHKSKGLEFPICFLSGLAKQFNMQDMRKPMVYDLDYGIGADYINPTLRFTTPTIRKRIIINKMKMEMLGEELRILYVAMTRAKEKLIMTGTVNDLGKVLKSQEMLEYIEKDTLPLISLLSVKSFMELIVAVLVRSRNAKSGSLHLRTLTKDDLVSHKVEEIIQKAGLKDKLLSQNNDRNAEFYDSIKNNFSFQYPFAHLSELITKTTVSELKKADLMAQNMTKNEVDGDSGEILFAEPEIVPYVPQFIKKEEHADGAHRGNAYHKVLEVLDFTKITTAASVENQMNELCGNKRLDKTECTLVQAEKIVQFINSNVGARMKEAQKKGLLYKEQPFMLGVDANKIKKEYPSEELVLVQGIIDAYFEEEGELVLVDYKTDRVDSASDLVQRYQLQLEYYAQALERLKRKPVKERILYSLHLGKYILVEKKTVIEKPM